MAVAKQDADWVNIDIDTLDTQTLNAYQGYKASYKTMKECREVFERTMAEAAKLPQGRRMIFGYNFGKLSVAVVEDDRKAPKAKATTQSLSDFLKAAQSHGDHT